MLLSSPIQTVRLVTRTLLIFVAALFSFDGSASVKIGGKHALEVKYYPIERADSLSGLDADIDKQARKNGLKTDAATDTSYKWLIKEVHEKGDGMCKVARINIYAATVILLPDFSQQMLSQDDMDTLLKSNAELLTHEFEHYRNHQLAYAKILQVVALSEFPCQTFKQSLKAKIESIIMTHKSFDEHIDAQF